LPFCGRPPVVFVASQSSTQDDQCIGTFCVFHNSFLVSFFLDSMVASIFPGTPLFSECPSIFFLIFSFWFLPPQRPPYQLGSAEFVVVPLSWEPSNVCLPPSLSWVFQPFPVRPVVSCCDFTERQPQAVFSSPESFSSLFLF